MDRDDVLIGDAVIYNHPRFGALDAEVIEIYSTYVIVRDDDGEYHEAEYRDLEAAW